MLKVQAAAVNNQNEVNEWHMMNNSTIPPKMHRRCRRGGNRGPLKRAVPAASSARGAGSPSEAKPYQVSVLCRGGNSNDTVASCRLRPPRSLHTYVSSTILRRRFRCVKKNLHASRPSEHPPVRGEKASVKTFRWDRRLQIHFFW